MNEFRLGSLVLKDSDFVLQTYHVHGYAIVISYGIIDSLAQ
jgi:hypothetical protein